MKAKTDTRLFDAYLQFVWKKICTKKKNQTAF